MSQFLFVPSWCSLSADYFILHYKEENILEMEVQENIKEESSANLPQETLQEDSKDSQ